ncbi:NBAS subunit of NRZ tethering complex-like [Lineus longissimus]|uniref:NBAS subunit of NRZ tethering complex-like n=1 Tax=Lineus longissimus TaxID=88925 RepID=UPI002B4EBCDA
MADGEMKSRILPDENILYDLSVPAEWQQECENANRHEKAKERSQVSIVGRFQSTSQYVLWTFLRSIGFPLRTASPCALPPDLVRLVTCQLHWQIAVGNDGKDVAILQDQTVEIRSTRDEFSTVHGRCAVSRDARPQWRKIVWSLDSTMLACSDSYGNVDVFDVVGTKLCTIPSATSNNPNHPIDLSRAIAGLVFTTYKPPTEDDIWKIQLLVINYQGALGSYLISRDSGYRKEHSFYFTSQYPSGLSCVEYDHQHNLILVGGTGRSVTDEGTSAATQQGITAWRSISISPYYKMITDYEEDKAKMQRSRSFLAKLAAMKPRWSREQPDGIFKMCISPDCNLLVSIHHSGKLSLWEMPSLRLRQAWTEADQPGLDEINPAIVENPRRKIAREYTTSPSVIDVNWWSDLALILARCSGSVTVSSVNELRNLLGKSPEWFEPSPFVSTAHDGGFLGLECECKYSSLKRHLVVSDDDEEDSDDEDVDDITYFQRTTYYMKHVLYYVTDSERFRPPRKKPKVVHRTYRLISLKSTTPEELYAKRLDNEEYGEALALAQAYGLDCDLVYQRQWRNTPVSVASIQDYLSKIVKRSWVLHECLERVPESIEAMRELLQYGLRGTDLEALIAIGKGEDRGRFILCDNEDYLSLEEEFDGFDLEAHEERVKEAERQRRAELTKQVNFKMLNLEQRELCRARTKLLQYLDRLATYEMILGGAHVAEEHFDHKVYEKFRAQNILEATVDFARACDYRAVDHLLTYHAEDLVPHRLAIISNFPETMSPADYRDLLPEAGMRIDDPEVLPWQCDLWREKDWCEGDICRAAIDPTPIDLGAGLYEDNTDYLQFKTASISKSLLTEWYIHRACEIERLSRLVDYSLELIKFGMERGVEGLEALHDDLVTLETLVYEGHAEDKWTLNKFQKLSSIEKLCLLMSKSSDEMFEKNMHRWLVPFLERCDRLNPGSGSDLMRSYLVDLAITDLTLCCKVFENSRSHQRQPVIKNEYELMSIALEGVYACERDDQLALSTAILECLPQRKKEHSGDIIKLHNLVDELERHLHAASILQKHGLPKTLAYIRDTQRDFEETKNLFTKLSRFAGRRVPHPNELQWKTLLHDMLDLCTGLMKSMQPKLVYEIFTESLLCSSNLNSIKLASEMMECGSNEAHSSTGSGLPSVLLQPKVEYRRAFELALNAAREYFNSSANLIDPCMHLAKSCLLLIKDKNVEIQQELDLIDSLGLLNEFGMNILPLQVRLNKDRLDLVRQALNSKSTNYIHAEKLLTLGHLLRVGGEDLMDEEGKVLKLVAQAALKAKDFRIAHSTCIKLMASGYGPVWTECEKLAETNEFHDIQAKVKLLSFAVTHCTPDMIEPILRAKCLLETQIIFEKVNTIMEPEQNSRLSPFSARGALEQTKEILTSTKQTTRHVLSTVSDKSWWKNTLKTLHPMRQQSEMLIDERDDGNQAMEIQGCHPFYAGIMEGAYLDKSQARYDKSTSMVREDNLHELLFRTAKLEETLTEGGTQQHATEVLIQLAQDSISRDTTLGLAYLLTLNKMTDAEGCLDSLPRTGPTLELAAYYYALQVYNILQPYNEPRWNSLYTQPPAKVIQGVIKLVTRNKKDEWSPDVKELIPNLLKYHDLLSDFTQAQILQGLGRGVNVGRFTKDHEYKRETILGLAMTLDAHVLKIAKTLAEKYDLPLWELYVTHLEFLFSDSGLATDELENRVNGMNVLALLKQNADQFRVRMKTYIYPTIEGTDYDRLIYYYTLLDGCEGKEKLSADTHIKLLKKIKAIIPNIDYKKLTDVEHDSLDLIQPHLTASNVQGIAKLAPKIPDKGDGFLNMSGIFALWAQHVFWQGDQASKKQPESLGEWMHRYELSAEFLQKLIPVDAIRFIDGITFAEASSKLSVECRAEIVKRVLKYSRQQGSKKKKQDDSNLTVTWEMASQHFQQSSVHLERLKQETYLAMVASDDEKVRSYAGEFDQSRSLPEKLESLLIRMILDGQTTEMIEDLLEFAPLERWTPATAVKEAVQHIVDQLRDHGGQNVSSILREKTPLEGLKNLVDAVRDHQENEGELVSQDDVLLLVRPFVSDSTIAIQPRLDILQILEQAFELSDEDLVLLILYRTEAIVETTWKDRQVTADDIVSDGKREGLFLSLLESSCDMNQLLALRNLLQVWPPLQAAQASPPQLHPWCKLFHLMVTKDPERGSSHVVDSLKQFKVSPMSSQHIKFLFEVMLSQGQPVPAVKSILIARDDDLYETAINELQSHTKAYNDSEMLKLLLQCHLASKIVTTHYYPPLIEYLLSHQPPDEESQAYADIEDIAHELAESGFDTEAGSLLLQHRGTHPALRTFDAALGLLSKWFKKD